MSGEIFDNDYTDGQTSLQGETQSWDAVLINAIDAALREVHVALPVKIVKVRGNSVVDIQPLLQRKYKDGTLVNLPVIQNVPVSMPRGADYWIKLPIAVGDTGFAVFCERSLDTWSVSGGIVDPADPRTHDLSDAVFYPGLYPSNDQVAGAPTDMVLHNGSAEILLKKAGKFKIKNDSQELFTITVDLLQVLIDALVETAFGPAPFTDETILMLQDIQDRLNTLKG